MSTRFDARKKYPWELWQNGDEHTIADPSPDHETLLRSLYQRARRTNTYVLTRTSHGAVTRVTFQFFDSPETYESARSRRPRDNAGHFTPNTHKGPDDALRGEPGHCNVCGARLAGSSAPYGVCMERQPDFSLVPKHQTTEETTKGSAPNAD